MKYTPPSANVPCKFKGFRTKQPKYGPIIYDRPVRDAALSAFRGDFAAANDILYARPAELMDLAISRAREIKHRLSLMGVK